MANRGLNDYFSFRLWLAGAVSAAISGAATAVTLMVVDPQTFNATPQGLKHLAVVAGITALVGLANYLKQSPLPPAWDGADRRTGGTEEKPPGDR